MKILISFVSLLWLSCEAAFAQSCDPFTAACRIQTISLQNYSLNELSLTGTIVTAYQSWALIQTPEQKLRLAALHETISPDANEIVEITARRITLKDKTGKISFLNLKKELSHDGHQNTEK